MSPRLSRSAASFVFLLVLVFASPLCAQVGPRIVGRPDNGVLQRIPGTTHPLVGVAREMGRAAASLPMERMLLHLSSSPEQTAAIEQLLADQQDPASPRYHAWLAPEQFGEQFGAAREDLDAITGWLESHGFRVSEVAAGRRSIEFSGTVQQVEAAFHTQIHRYEWNGREHIANASDILIPAAFAPVVAGVASLHNFGPRPLHHIMPVPAPQTNFSGGVHGLSPYDFAAIYDVAPLWTAGYDGTGQSIAIVGESDIAMSDVTGFRAQFGLPVNNPTFIVNGTDPGYVDGDETESDLDVEWAGAVAKGATIKFVTSASTNSSDGVTLSAQYIVQHATAPVMSLSYGLCEAQMGSGNSFYSSLWQQAAAEGIAVFVAAGDSGSAGCDVPYSTTSSGTNNTTPATQGFGINGLASTPYSVAVGGTEFNDSASPSTYWNAANNTQLASAKGYIPEMAWNESSYAAGSSNSNNNLYAGGGGTSIVWQRPTWQTAPGMPSGAMRLTPDVSLTAAGHDGYVVEQAGALYLVGGTSASTPSFAGLMAIVNQYTHSTNGNPNSKLYALASSAPSVFHDVTAGSNAVPCEGGSPNCSASAPSANVGTMKGYSAATGYDLATGLGSVDANALVTNWGGKTAVGPSITTLSPNPMTGSASNQNLTVNGTGFVSGSGLTVTVGTVTYQGSAVNFVSSSQLVVSVNVGATAQTLSVKVAIPGGKTSNSVTLTVTAPSAGPAIAALSPNPMTGSNSPQTLVIGGSGFVAGSGSKVTVGTVTYQSSQIGPTQLIVLVTVGASGQSLPVKVTNPNGQVSNSATLTVTAPAAAPVITALTPNPMAASTSVQTLTIKGSGFVAGNSLKVTVGTAVYQGSQIGSVSTTQLAVSVTVGASAQSLPVQVINPNGQASNPVALTVTAPTVPPAIAALTPNPMTGSNSVQTLTIKGSGFVAGNSLKVTVGTAVYQGSQISSVSTSQLAVSVNAGTGAQTLPVQVTNPNGQASNTMMLAVTAPIVSPAITTLSPNPTTGSNSPQTLTVNGSGFQSGLKLLIGGTAIPASVLSELTPTQLQVIIITGLTAYTYPVQVVNSNGGASNVVNFQVNAPPIPAITSLTPNPLSHSTAAQVLTVNGSNFQSGTGLKVTVGGASYSGSQVTVVNASQLKVNVTVSSAASATLAVQVTNPSGAVSNVAALPVK